MFWDTFTPWRKKYSKIGMSLWTVEKNVVIKKKGRKSIERSAYAKCS